MMMEQALDLNLIRIHRKQNRKINGTLGTTVDEYEAMVNEMQLQMQMLTSQAQQEVKNVETVKNEIEAQIKSSQDEILKFLNNYSASMVEKLMDSVSINADALKFRGTAVYDLSFIRNFDYSKVNLINDSRIKMSRPKGIENLRLKLIEYKTEFFFSLGLIEKTSPLDPMYSLLVNQRNIYLMQYYKVKAEYYNEVCLQGIISNPTNDLSTINDFISYNDENIKKEKENLESIKHTLTREEYDARNEKLTYIMRMVLMAKMRRRYIEEALNSDWELPSFDDIRSHAGRFNVTFSKAVSELKESTNYTMLYPTWFMKIAEMYNVIQRFDEGNVVEINPKDDRWLRKASELVDLDTGLNNSVLKFLDATTDYWAVLILSIESSENAYIDEVIDIAYEENDNIPDYPVMLIVPEFLIQSAIDDEREEVGFGGFPKNVFRSAVSFVKSIGQVIADTVKKIGSIITKLSKVAFKFTQKVAVSVANEVKRGLENTIGRVLPESVWAKIRSLTDVGLDILSLNVSKETLKKAVRGIVDITLFPLRVNEEIFKYLDRQGVMKYLDKYSGGVFTSCRNLINVPMKLEKGEKINWAMVALDALKVWATVMTVGAMASVANGIANYGFKEYMKRNATGSSFLDGVLGAGFMVMTGQSNFTQAVTDGSKVVATKAVVQNTALGKSTLGQTVASMGVNATVTSIASNTAFNDEAKKIAEKEAKKFMSSKAQKEVLEASGVKLPPKYADALSNSAYNYITNTSININDDGFYKDWMKVDINASNIMGKIQREAQNGYQNAKDAITRLANTEFSSMNMKDRDYLEKLGILAEDMKDGAKSALEKASKAVQAIADAKLKVDMDDVYKLADKYGSKMFEYLFNKYGPRFDYDDLITPDDFLNYQIHVTTPGRRITKINYLSNNTANFALAGVLGVGILGLLAYNAE